MPARPEILFPLFGDITGLPGVGRRIAGLLEHLDIRRPRDLLFTLPTGGIDRNMRRSVHEAALPAVVTVEAEVLEHHPPRAKGRPWRVSMRDQGGSFQLIFFHPRPDWIRRTLPEGARRIVSGRAELFDGVIQMPHPDHILPPARAHAIPPFEPVYPLTAGLGARTMRRVVLAALDLAPPLPEWIEPGVLTRHKWPAWTAALHQAHHPRGAGDLTPTAPARQRLAYDELFAHQLTLALVRARRQRSPGRPSPGTGRLQERLRRALPYALTAAQERVIAEIRADMASERRMSRLLQGDVGAGKTVVAMMALLTAVESGGQGAMMAPTEILARQHFDSLRPLAEAAGVRMALLTGRDTGRARQQKLAALKAGEIDILLGTHAVIQRDVDFADLRLAVIDEQHRFGVRQRMELGDKGDRADLLVMTATPIPRSLALAQYGDMDLSVLDEKPPGRKPVSTVLVSDSRTDEVIAHLKQAVASGRQAYWVCPLVTESETVEWMAAERRHAALARELGADRVGLVHGQMPPAEKDAAMARFVAGETRVLVATTVIEVGVDVPNASIMVIEQAEHFGLAQLHQLRGRVGRGSAESACVLLYSPPLSPTARARLTALRENDDGFALAEIDLRLRGAGDVLGVAQSGLPRFRVADLETQAGLMELARDDARLLLATDPLLDSDRGRAARTLLWLMERTDAMRLLEAG